MFFALIAAVLSVRWKQENASSAIVASGLSIVKYLIGQPDNSSRLMLLAFTFNVSNDLQPLNAQPSIDVTELPIVTEVNA